VLNYAVDQGMLTSNPAAGTKKYRSQGEGHHSWTEGESAQFERHYPIGSKARLAMALGLYTAQRKGDVLRMGWQHVIGDCITVRQEKTDAALLIPMHSRLVAVLASVPRSNLTFLMTEHGAPFTSNGFGNWFRDRCNEAGLPECSFHDLCKTASHAARKCRCSVDQVKAVTPKRLTSAASHGLLPALSNRLSTLDNFCSPSVFNSSNDQPGGTRLEPQTQGQPRSSPIFRAAKTSSPPVSLSTRLTCAEKKQSTWPARSRHAPYHQRSDIIFILVLGLIGFWPVRRGAE
jgi:hypothetical protein